MTLNSNAEELSSQGVRRIPLGRDRFALVDEADFEWISAFKWHSHPRNTKCYAGRFVRDPERGAGCQAMHREILSAPKGVAVDHRDGNGLNNTRQNLRLASSAQNARNRRDTPNRKRGAFKGVTFHGGLWRAMICFMDSGTRRSVYLGHFALPEDAARAYDAGARERFGEFAATNFELGES